MIGNFSTPSFMYFGILKHPQIVVEERVTMMICSSSLFHTDPNSIQHNKI